MKRISIFTGIILAAAAIGLAACSAAGGAFSFPTATPQSPPMEVTRLPSPEGAARAFLDGWKAGDYEAMYAMLTSLSRDAMTMDAFVTYYQTIRDEATLRTLDYRLANVKMTSSDAEIAFDVTLHTVLVGDITKSTRMLLKYQGGGWKVAWDETTVLPELKGGNSLVMYHDAPARGNIYDRNGKALASESEAVAIGIVSGEITDEGTLVSYLAKGLHMPRARIEAKIDYDHPDWYIPIGDVDKNDPDFQGVYGTLSSIGGVRMTTTKMRYYYGGGVGSTVVGYMQQPSAENLAYYKSLGYSGDERVGKTGLEAWGEQYLAGKQGGTLWVVSPTGSRLATLAESKPEPGMAIYTTIDRDLQTQMERTLMGPFTGAAVVLNRNDGEVLAMMSSPLYDSNLFDPQNPNNQYLQTLVLDKPGQPLLNRATMGLYPLGSVFKVITMSAGLESGLFVPGSMFDCNGYFEVPGFSGTDWTVEHEVKPHGKINLVQGLTRSCDTFFWHVGYELYFQDAWLVPNMARAYGLGKPTGIGVIQEEAGFVPDPAWKHDTEGEDWTTGDALNQAIGQGKLQVTPLQVVDYMAAVGNGGTLYRPQLILKIQPPIGDPVFTFQPEIRGILPVSADNLAAIQTGLRGVVSDPNGTARAHYYGITDIYNIAGKTGTASNGTNYPHAWFAGYTFEEAPNKPDIAAVVIVESSGEGSTYASPMVRRIIEIYFQGQPSTYYQWESTYGMRGTDTPEYTETPEETPAP